MKDNPHRPHRHTDRLSQTTNVALEIYCKQTWFCLHLAFPSFYRLTLDCANIMLCSTDKLKMCPGGCTVPKFDITTVYKLEEDQSIFLQLGFYYIPDCLIKYEYLSLTDFVSLQF